MARINIEDSIYKDFRFMNLVMKLGSVDHAIGSLVRAWSLAQDFFLDEETNGMVPVKEWQKQGINNLLLEVGFAEAHDNLIRVSGSEEQFAWLVSKQENGKKGGRPRKANESYENLQVSNDANSKANESYGNPLTHSPTLTHSQKPKTHNTGGGEVGDIKSAQEKSVDELAKIAKGKVKFDDVATLYNQILAGVGKLKHVRDAGDVTRKEFLNSLSAYPTLDHWKILFETVRASKKLTGQVPTTFVGNFSWLVKKENALKVEQGAYDDDFSDIEEKQLKKNLERLELK